jgi:hypothetical protein
MQTLIIYSHQKKTYYLENKRISEKLANDLIDSNPQNAGVGWYKCGDNFGTKYKYLIQYEKNNHKNL